MTNMVNKPKHYIGVNGMEVEEVLENFLPKIKDGYVAHRVGSAIEYLLRHPEKNGDEDILKAEQNIKQIADYNERKLIEPEDFQQENELSTFLRSLSDMPKESVWTHRLVPDERISTHYHGMNPND